MNKIGLIFGREYTSRVKKKSFVLLTILVPVLIGAGLFLAMWWGMSRQKHFKVLVVDPRGLCDSKVYVGQDEVPPATFYFYDEILLFEDFRDNDKFQGFDMMVAIDPDVITNKTINAVYRDEPNVNTQLYIKKKLESRLEEFFAIDEGISLDTYHKIKQSFKFTLYDVENQEQSEMRLIQQIVGLTFSLLIFVFILVYAGRVMSSVLEEKTSRVVEIIISSVKPIQLMMGKILAIGLVGLTQFVIWIVLIFIILMMIKGYFVAELDPSAINVINSGDFGGGVFNGLAGNDNMVQELIFEQINWYLFIFLFVIYFVGGFLLYGSFFAIVGAASDSETDTQQLIIPVVIPLLFVLMMSVWIIGNPGGQAAIWGSQMPLSSPIIMLQRVAAGTVGVWEVVMSIVLLVGAFLLTIYMAAKVYRTGILMYGKKASWKEIYKWLKH